MPFDAIYVLLVGRNFLEGSPLKMPRSLAYHQISLIAKIGNPSIGNKMNPCTAGEKTNRDYSEHCPIQQLSLSHDLNDLTITDHYC